MLKASFGVLLTFLTILFNSRSEAEVSSNLRCFSSASACVHWRAGTPIISPDGKTIFFTLTYFTDAATIFSNGVIRLDLANDNASSVLSDCTVVYSDARLSRDGARLAVIATKHARSSDNPGVYISVVELESAKPMLVVDERSLHLLALSFGDTNDKLFYAHISSQSHKTIVTEFELRTRLRRDIVPPTEGATEESASPIRLAIVRNFKVYEALNVIYFYSTFRISEEYRLPNIPNLKANPSHLDGKLLLARFNMYDRTFTLEADNFPEKGANPITGFHFGLKTVYLRLTKATNSSILRFGEAHQKSLLDLKRGTAGFAVNENANIVVYAALERGKDDSVGPSTGLFVANLVDRTTWRVPLSSDRFFNLTKKSC